MGKLKANLRMYKDFFGGYIKYRKKIKLANKWINRYAQQKGLAVNPNKMYLTNLKIWLAENEEMYGKRICPCFEATGDRHLDRNLICPCVYAKDDIEEHGTCHCNLFGKADLTFEDWKVQEKRIMTQYRIQLNITNNTVNTKGVPVDKSRIMDVPDPVHQLKQSLNQFDNPFHMVVEREQSARNILAYCDLKGIKASYFEDEASYIVKVEK